MKTIKKLKNIIENIIAFTIYISFYLGYLAIIILGAYGFYKIIDGIVLWLLA